MNTNAYGVKESFSVRSEVLNLVFEIKSFDDRFLHPVLVVLDGCKVLVRVLLSEAEYSLLRSAFSKKEKVEWNFFDNVLATVDNALQK